MALDGDADRVIAVDHTGAVVDGDVLLALFALDLAERGRLAGNTVVVTVMTNLGFRLAMEAHGIAVRETDVGDRHVLAALDADGLPSGASSRATSSSGRSPPPATASSPGIALADLMLRSGRSLADLATGLVERVPQRLVNVPIPQPERLADCPEVWEAVAKAEAELGHEGRVLLRPSGTEPLVRVMVEARDEAKADAVAAQLAGGRRGRARRRWAGRGPPRPPGSLGPMCGIIGVTGEADALPLILGALHQLEYRGYDSAGVALVADGEIWRARAADGTHSVADLAGLTADAPDRPRARPSATPAGPPTASPTPENAHPHVDCTGRLALIHNGIIENHAELRAELVADGPHRSPRPPTPR